MSILHIATKMRLFDDIGDVVPTAYALLIRLTGHTLKTELLVIGIPGVLEEYTAFVLHVTSLSFHVESYDMHQRISSIMEIHLHCNRAVSTIFVSVCTTDIRNVRILGHVT